MTAHTSDILKGRIRQFWHDHGRNLSLVARTFHINWRTARRALMVIPRGTRKPKRVPRHISLRRTKVSNLARAVRVIDGVPYPLYCSVRELQAALRSVGQHVTQHQVRNDLRALGFKSLVRQKVPTRNLAVHAKRLAFCRSVMAKGLPFARRIIFSDEHYVTTNDNTRRTMWVPTEGTVLPRELKKVGGAASIMMWGAIGVGYKSQLVVFPRQRADGEPFRMNANDYIRRCLSRVMADLKGRVFMQDGARPHVCKRTMKYLETKGVCVLQDWPPYSPDMNPIEHLWSILNDRIARDHPRNANELEQSLKRNWDAISQAEIDTLCERFSKKVKRVHDDNGACV